MTNAHHEDHQGAKTDPRGGRRRRCRERDDEKRLVRSAKITGRTAERLRKALKNKRFRLLVLRTRSVHPQTVKWNSCETIAPEAREDAVPAQAEREAQRARTGWSGAPFRKNKLLSH
jgi:hypothetical protein